jgi:hypothetical protein
MITVQCLAGLCLGPTSANPLHPKPSNLLGPSRRLRQIPLATRPPSQHRRSCSITQKCRRDPRKCRLREERPAKRPKLSKAEAMMVKMRYVKGQGLGKDSDGVTTHDLNQVACEQCRIIVLVNITTTAAMEITVIGITLVINSFSISFHKYPSLPRDSI